jgi:hypothetical protein
VVVALRNALDASSGECAGDSHGALASAELNLNAEGAVRNRHLSLSLSLRCWFVGPSDKISSIKTSDLAQGILVGGASFFEDACFSIVPLSSRSLSWR